MIEENWGIGKWGHKISKKITISDTSDKNCNVSPIFSVEIILLDYGFQSLRNSTTQIIEFYLSNL